MSDTDSFINEVNDEVRRDRLYALLKRYGWIAVLAVVLLVGGAAWTEYRKAQDRAQAEALGDAMLAALSVDDTAERAAALSAINVENAQGAAVVNLLAAAELAEAGDTPAAVARLDAVATDGGTPDLYRQIARFKAATLQSGTAPAADLRQTFEALANPGMPLRLLAQEQLALIDIKEGAPEAAVEKYQAILADAEVTSDLQQRALQVIVALGADPKMDGIADPLTDTPAQDSN